MIYSFGIMKQRIIVSGFINNNGKFLLVRRAANDSSYPEFWEIPGGKLEINETPHEGLLRELKEETGINVDIISPISVAHFTIPAKNTQYIQINFLCYPNSEINITLSQEHSDFAWITFEVISEYKINPQMKQEILKFKNHRLLKE